jgi:hypothetical protein
MRVCTNHALLRSIYFHQVSMHAAVNHIYPTSESCCSRTSITIHTCTTFPIEDRAFYLVFFIRAPDVEPRHYCRWGSHCASNQAGYDSLTPFFPNRERQLLISPHPMLLLQHCFFRHERHYKDIFLVIVVF